MLAEIKTEIQIGWQDQFAAWLDQRYQSQNSISAYVNDVNLYCRWFEEINGQSFTPDLMNSTDARSFRQYTLDVERRSPSTWNRRRAALAVLCTFIEEQYGITLFRMNRIPRADDQENSIAPRWLSEADKRRVLRELEIEINAANTPDRRERAIRDQAMIALIIFAGLRISEVLNLQIADVTIKERSGSVVVRSGKGGKFRTVPLSNSVREMLSEWLQNRSGASDYVFSAKNSAKISVRAAQKRLQRLESRLGIEGLEPHALRHTCAKSMLDAGARLNEVQRILGHKRIQTTCRYVEPSHEDLAGAVEAGELGKYGRKHGG